MSFFGAPGFTVTAPQQEAGLGGGAALITAAAVLAFGPIASASFMFGTHAKALYDAEAAKSKVQQSLVGASGSTPRVPTFSSGAAGPQFDPLANGRIAIYPPLPIIVPLIVTTFTTTQPQTDPLALAGYQDFYLATSQSGGGIPSYEVPSVDSATLYNAEAAKTKVWPARSPGTLLAPVPPFRYSAEIGQGALYAEAAKHQVWPAVASAPQTGQVSPFATTGPQLVDLTLQPFIDAPQFSPQGWLMPWAEAEPQPGADWQPQPLFTPKAFAPPAQPLRSLYAAPQSVDLTIPALFVKALQNPGGPFIRGFTAAPLPVDLTLAPRIQQGIQGVQGPPIRGFVVPPLPVDLTLGAQVWKSVRTASPVAGFTVAAPQSIDLTLQPDVQPSVRAPPVFTAGLGSFVLVPAQRPDQAAGSAIFSPAQPRPSTALSSFVRAAPWLEPWQPAPIHWTPVIGTVPRVGILGEFVSAAPAGKELQGVPFASFRGAIPVQPSLFGWAEVIALKQLGVSGLNVVISALSQAGVEGAESSFLANSACFVTAKYFDINNVNFVPAAVSYRIDDLLSEANIVPWTPITPALMNTITVTSAQNGMISLSRQCEEHQMLLLIVDGAGDQCYARVKWNVKQTVGAPT